MKLNLHHAVWALALAFAVTVLCAPTIAAAYQSERELEHGRSHDVDNDYANNSNYQQGWNHGQDDRANNRDRSYRVRPDNDLDRRAYESGYNQGYQGNNTYPGQYGQYGQYGPNGNRQYGQYGPNGNRQYGNNMLREAYNNGFQNGVRYGQTDRNTGHSNRPSYSSTYRNGSSGYNSAFGNQTAYKNSFREGFRAGYAQGYNSGREGYRDGYRR